MPQQEAPREYKSVFVKGKWIPADEAGNLKAWSDVHDPERCLLCKIEALANDRKEA